MSFAKEVWDKLSTLDVGEHTEKRGQFTFLSWTWAWSALMSHYPESTYDFSDPVEINGSMEMRVSITIKDGDKELTRTMWLPVMDFKNNAVKNPMARDVSDARMRCLVKCLAMFGLGHYIYAGQDLPVQPEQPKPEPLATDEQKAHITAFAKAGNLSPRRSVWIKAEKDGHTNWSRMTVKHAAEIIKECEALAQEQAA